MTSEYFTNNSSQTKKLGRILAEKIFKERVDGRSKIVALKGGLGGGKTTFLQGFAKGLGVEEKILSPTFVIVKKFKIKKRRKFKFFYHIDCYRIQGPKEILDLDFKKIISESQNIVAIEWSERILDILPKNTILINFEFVNKNKRKIIIKWPKEKRN